MEFIKNIDLGILNFVSDNFNNEIVNKIMSSITTLGNHGYIWIAIILGLLLFKKTRHIGILAIISLMIGYILGEVILKPMIARPRPFIDYEYLRMLVAKPSGYSMPSGHTISSFAVATTIYKLIKDSRIKIVLMVLAILMALSRVYLCVHYPSDIIVGSMLGIIVANIVCRLYNMKKES